MSFTMASSTPTPSITTITTVTPKTRPRRASRFTEGSPLTGAELAQQSTDNAFLLSILTQMDEHEARKARSSSNASTDSFSSPFSSRKRRDTGSSSNGSHSGNSPVQGEFVIKERVGRRSITFGRTEDARKSLQVDERPKGDFADGVEVLAVKFKGRLRALTGGRERNVKPYEGT